MTKAERDAWAAAYRVYEEYVPALEQAARLHDDNDTAVRLFTAAGNKIVTAMAATDENGRIVLAHCHGMLTDAFKHAQEGAQDAPECTEVRAG